MTDEVAELHNEPKPWERDKIVVHGGGWRYTLHDCAYDPADGWWYSVSEKNTREHGKFSPDHSVQLDGTWVSVLSWEIESGLSMTSAKLRWEVGP